MKTIFESPKRSLLFVLLLATLVGMTVAQLSAPAMDSGLGLHVYVDCTVEIERVGEPKILWSHHAGVLTTIGKNYVEGKLGDSTYTNNSKYADDISLSTSSSSPAAGWLIIPTEITSGGLERATSTYASTGDGQWTISHQFTSSSTHTDVQLTGLNWDATYTEGALLAADTFTAVSLGSGDKITVTWTVTVS